MQKVHLILAPDTIAKTENKIARHIVENLDNPTVCWELADRRQVRMEPSESFYDLSSWMDYQIEKTRQLHIMRRLGEVADRDVLFFADAWFPGLDIARMLFPRAYFAGFVHGAACIPGDLMENSTWARSLESVWFKNIYSCLLVQTKHTEQKLPVGSVVVGSPFDPEPFKNSEAKDIDILWPHRPSPDKGFDTFLRMGRELSGRGYKVMFTTSNSDVPRSIRDGLIQAGIVPAVNCVGDNYKKILARAKVVLSTAVQETWGYAVMEAVASGAIPVVPNAACYPYLYPELFRYSSFRDAVPLIEQFLRHPVAPPEMPKVVIKGSFVDGQFVTKVTV